MWWEFHFALIQILIKWLLQNLAHGPTAGLSWHVPNFVAIWSPVIELELNELSIEFELWWKNRKWNGYYNGPYIPIHHLKQCRCMLLTISQWDPVIDVFDVRLIFGATLPEFPWLACNAQSSASFSQGTTAWVQLINYSRYCAVAFINTLRLRQDGRLFADDIFNAFSWMKKYEFQLKFHCLFLRVLLALTSIGSDNGLAPNRWQAIIWTNAG